MFYPILPPFVTLAKVVYFFKLQGFFSVIFALLKEAGKQESRDKILFLFLLLEILIQKTNKWVYNVV